MKPDTTPLLPETPFKPLAPARLQGMIDHALTHRQLPAQAQVITFRQPWLFGTGMAAMAASILLGFMVMPQYTSIGSLTASTGTDLATSDDISDLILLDTFGA